MKLRLITWIGHKVNSTRSAANDEVWKRAGITKEDLAFKAGIDRTYASQIERAIANPSLAIICALSDVLKCNYFDLIGNGPKKWLLGFVKFFVGIDDGI